MDVSLIEINEGVTVRFVQNSRKTKNGQRQNGLSGQNGQKIGQSGQKGQNGQKGQKGHSKTFFFNHNYLVSTT